MCDWCNENIPATTSVTDISGSLKFCGFLCLNKYKMNLFCMEAQQHLPQFQKEMATQLNYVSPDKKMLITPELWLSDGNSSDHGPHRIKKCQKVKDKSHSAEKVDSDPKSESIIQDYSRSHATIRHSNHLKKRQKVDLIHENFGKNTKDTNHEHSKSFLNSKPIKLSELNPQQATSQSSPGKLDFRQYMNNPSNLPLFFLPPWIGPPPASNLPPFFLANPQGQNFEFPISKYPRPLPLATNTTSCPLLLPIPVPIPIPVLISGDTKKDADIKITQTEVKSHKPSQTSVQDAESHSPDRVIDFSFHKSRSRRGTVPLQELQPPESNPTPTMPQALVYNIKTEPDDPLSSTLTQTRTSYADRRSLILDAPPPAKIDRAYDCSSAPRRPAHNRKRCYSVHVKTK